MGGEGRIFLASLTTRSHHSFSSTTTGAAWPMFAIIFAQFTTVFADPMAGDFMGQVNQVALYFLYLSIAACVAAFFQASMWMWTGHRQTSRIRQMYLQAVLRQDVEFFDTQTTTGSLLEGLNEDGNAVQQAISEKVGDFLQHTATFTVGYIIAFWRGWDMTLVMVGTIPFLAGVGAILAKLSTWTSAKSSAAYVEASSLAQQARPHLALPLTSTCSSPSCFVND
jgi:ATP-binding cassette subfamily B (MDR/TAP) protein 1